MTQPTTDLLSLVEWLRKRSQTAKQSSSSSIDTLRKLEAEARQLDAWADAVDCTLVRAGEDE